MVRFRKKIIFTVDKLEISILDHCYNTFILVHAFNKFIYDVRQRCVCMHIFEFTSKDIKELLYNHSLTRQGNNLRSLA